LGSSFGFSLLASGFFLASALVSVFFASTLGAVSVTFNFSACFYSFNSALASRFLGNGAAGSGSGFFLGSAFFFSSFLGYSFFCAFTGVFSTGAFSSVFTFLTDF